MSKVEGEGAIERLRVTIFSRRLLGLTLEVKYFFKSSK